MTHPIAATAVSERMKELVSACTDFTYSAGRYHGQKASDYTKGVSLDNSNAAERELLTAIADLESQLAKTQRERDLAIAHDRQPYPTAEAYEIVCKARTQWQERAQAAESQLAALQGASAQQQERIKQLEEQNRRFSRAAVFDAD